MTINSIREGFRWIRADLHIHTPASEDYAEPNITYLEILQEAERRELELIAFTDHNSVRGYEKMRQEIEMLEMLDRAQRLTDEEQQRLAADGLRRLCELADPFDINVIVENHGGLSSHGNWLAGVMRQVDHPRCGTLPDFGNFYEYDRYQGVAELMPFARAVSAKSHDFDAEGNETTKDFRRLMRTVLDAGYRGWVGIEYEGDRLPEREGIRLTKELLERIRTEMSS